MWQRLRNWLTDTDFQRGLDFATARLFAEGHAAAKTLSTMTRCAAELGEYNGFSRGIDRAVANYHRAIEELRK